MRKITFKDKTKETSQLIEEARADARSEGLRRWLVSLRADVAYICIGKRSRRTIYYKYPKEDED